MTTLLVCVLWYVNVRFHNVALNVDKGKYLIASVYLRTPNSSCCLQGPELGLKIKCGVNGERLVWRPNHRIHSPKVCSGSLNENGHVLSTIEPRKANQLIDRNQSKRVAHPPARQYKMQNPQSQSNGNLLGSIQKNQKKSHHQWDPAAWLRSCKGLGTMSHVCCGNILKKKGIGKSSGMDRCALGVRCSKIQETKTPN